MLDFIRANAGAIQMWVAVACTLGIYSILYKENKIYRFFEHAFIGLAMGWTIRAAWVDILYPNFYQRIFQEGRWWWFLSLPLGLMLYLIYSRKYNWMARISIGFLLGLSAGQTFQSFAGLYYKQIVTTFKPIVPQAAEGSIKAVTLSGAINNLIFLAIIICVMTYFFFSFEVKSRAVQKTANTGRWVLMIAFGAIFGSTIMARMALFISRMDFLIKQFGGTFIPWLK
jgi:hypothetical protein